jgi:hypothetical protein
VLRLPRWQRQSLREEMTSSRARLLAPLPWQRCLRQILMARQMERSWRKA